MKKKFSKTIIKKFNYQHKQDWPYKVPLYLAYPLQLALVVKTFVHGSDSLTEALVSGAMCGVSGGILGIASSHELIHRMKKWERNYGSLMLFTINYPHFAVEHMWHHITVATIKDPDTARRNETIYSFILRAIPHGWLVCWKWEASKTKKRNESVISLKNKMLRITLIQFAIFTTIFAVGGVNPLAAFMTQGLVTIFLLKWINYVEHYGLLREEVNGKTESVGIHHSWDTTNALSNWSLFNLGFHSHHHAAPNVEYHDIPACKEEWNELPKGYAAMMLLSLSPYHWRKVMHGLLATKGA